MERLLLIHKIIKGCINLNYLENNKYIDCVFALNDFYELKGHTNLNIIEKLYKNEI